MAAPLGTSAAGWDSERDELALAERGPNGVYSLPTDDRQVTTVEHSHDGTAQATGSLIAQLRSEEGLQHLQRANTRLLLACAVQASRDRGMLEKYVHRLGPPEASSSMPFEI